ncbi:MAG: ribose-phosphate diphosphokinase [Candidatus Bathyarchaeia archaeon]
MVGLLIAPAPASRELGLRIANILNAPWVEVESKVFPDGESYVRFCRDLTGEEVMLVQSTHPPQDSHLIQLFLLIDAAFTHGARRVSAVVPYIAYARQDKVFRTWEAVSIKTILKLLHEQGLHRLITVNMHEPAVLSDLKIQAENLDATPAVGAYLKGLKLNKPVVFAPDKRAFPMARKLGEMLSAESGWLTKERDRLTGQIHMTCEVDLDFSGRDFIIADDIISTGGTVALAARMLRERGAARITCACVHPLLTGDAYDKILAAGVSEIVGTDTVPSRVGKVSVAPTIAEGLSHST